MDGTGSSHHRSETSVRISLGPPGCSGTVPVYKRSAVSWKIRVFSRLLIIISSPLVFFLWVSRRAVRMGQHVWLLLATIITEILVIRKWSKGQFPNPVPLTVKWCWAIGATLLVLYPTIQVSFYRSFIALVSLHDSWALIWNVFL